MKVLDVGSGHNPHPKATLLSDLYVGPTHHRGAFQERPAVMDERPFVCCDAAWLPFKSHVFYFVICSHVVEHHPHPDLAMAELKRVGRHGEISFPTGVWQTFTTNPGHLWQIDKHQKQHKSLFTGIRGATIKVIAPILRKNFRVKARLRLIDLFKVLLKRDIHEAIIRW